MNYTLSIFAGNSVGMGAVQENLRKLVMARYVEHCPTAEPFLESPTEDDAPARKRGAKSSKVISYLYYWRGEELIT